MLRTILKHFVVCCLALMWANMLSLEKGYLSNDSMIIGILIYTYFNIYLVVLLKRAKKLYPWIKYILIFIIATLFGYFTQKPGYIAYYNFYTFSQIFLFNVLTYNPNDVNKGV